MQRQQVFQVVADVGERLEADPLLTEQMQGLSREIAATRAGIAAVSTSSGSSPQKQAAPRCRCRDPARYAPAIPNSSTRTRATCASVPSGSSIKSAALPSAHRV